MLVVLRALGSDGPVTPHQLMALTGLDRSGVHRAVAALISEGFARYQLGHRQIVLTDAALQDFRAARSAPEDVERASEAIRTVIRGKRIHADIATLAGPGQLAVVESTEPESASLEYDDARASSYRAAIGAAAAYALRASGDWNPHGDIDSFDNQGPAPCFRSQRR
jgi:DNA-binding IclR family transcriptional regulator